MAYIPPHKRHTKDSSSPKPESLVPAFRKKLSFGEPKRKEKDFWGFVYVDGAVSKWFVAGFAETSLFLSLVRLQPFPVESSFERKSSQIPLSLVLLEGCSERMIDKPWLWVAENVKNDLLLSFQSIKCEMEEVKPDVVARFGKILFYGNSSICQESLKSNSLDESTLSQMRRSLYTNIPLTYMEFIENLVVEKLQLEYVQEKEIYLVKLFDKLRLDSIVGCKCIVAKDRKRIQLYKIELNPVRRMVADVSCLGKTVDLRLIICTKKIKTVLSDDEINGIKDLIGSAILDTEVKGGLRWPFGMDSSEGRYALINVHHTITKSYRNSLIRFKLRHADRFDFKSSIGEVTREIFVKMPGVVSELRKQTMDENLLFKMVEENLKLIWDHCMIDDCSS